MDETAIGNYVVNLIKTILRKNSFVQWCFHELTSKAVYI